MTTMQEPNLIRLKDISQRPATGIAGVRYAIENTYEVWYYTTTNGWQLDTPVPAAYQNPAVFQGDGEQTLAARLDNLQSTVDTTAATATAIKSDTGRLVVKQGA